MLVQVQSKPWVTEPNSSLAAFSAWPAWAAVSPMRFGIVAGILPTARL
jgi:hypothetical protein